MECEDRENHNYDDDKPTQQDPFIDEGLSSGGSDCEANAPNSQYAQTTRRLRKAFVGLLRITEDLSETLWCRSPSHRYFCTVAKSGC